MVDLGEERPNAMLTTADRRYLTGDVDPDDYADFNSWCRNRRKQIRERVFQSILDFHLVSTELHIKDRLDVHFGEEGSQEPEFAVMLSDMLKFIGLRGPQGAEWIIKQGLKHGIQEIKLLQRDCHVNYEIDIDIRETGSTDISTLVERYNANEPLSSDELRSLYVSNHISLSQLDEALTELMEQRDGSHR